MIVKAGCKRGESSFVCRFGQAGEPKSQGVFGSQDAPWGRALGQSLSRELCAGGGVGERQQECLRLLSVLLQDILETGAPPSVSPHPLHLPGLHHGPGTHPLAQAPATAPELSPCLPTLSLICFIPFSTQHEEM